MTQITTRLVTLENFDDLAGLIEARGGPHYCWCMAFRDKPREDMDTTTAERKAWRKGLMFDRVAAGETIGLLAYDGEKPIGWCSTGPMAGFRRLGGPQPDAPAKIWAISCFFIPRAHRKSGLMRLMTLAAIQMARAAGATDFRASPVAPSSPTYKFQGIVPLFEDLGFQHLGMAGKRRHIMHLPLT